MPDFGNIASGAASGAAAGSAIPVIGTFAGGILGGLGSAFSGGGGGQSSEQRNLAGIYNDNPGITSNDIAALGEADQIAGRSPGSVLLSPGGIQYVLVNGAPAVLYRSGGYSAQGRLNAELGFPGVHVPTNIEIQTVQGGGSSVGSTIGGIINKFLGGSTATPNPIPNTPATVGNGVGKLLVYGSAAAVGLVILILILKRK
jgi:hypothetical protein